MSLVAVHGCSHSLSFFSQTSEEFVTTYQREFRAMNQRQPGPGMEPGVRPAPGVSSSSPADWNKFLFNDSFLHSCLSCRLTVKLGLCFSNTSAKQPAAAGRWIRRSHKGSRSNLFMVFNYTFISQHPSGSPFPTFLPSFSSAPAFPEAAVGSTLSEA